MGALLAKLLSFFGFRTLALSGQSEAPGRRSRASTIGRESRQSLKALIHKSPSDTAKMHIRKRSTVIKPDIALRKVQWFGEAQSVFVTGSWLNWNEKVELVKNPNSETIWESEVELPTDAGDVFEMKFIVDDVWTNSSDMATRPNEEGILNNILILSETENSDS